MRRSPLPAWFLVSLAWCGPALLAVFRVYIQGRYGGDSPATLRMIAWEGGDWLLYGVFTPVIFQLGQRFPLTGRSVFPRLSVHVVAAFVFCAGWTAGGWLLGWWLAPDAAPPVQMGWLAWFITSLPFGLAVYFAVLGVAHAVAFFIEARERETQAARLSEQLSAARFAALQMQMRPHFLLNALNAITVVARDRDSEKATAMLEQLGDMLHRVLRSDRPKEVPLAEELEFVRQYLAIESIRFPDRLQPVFAVDASLLPGAVPEFVLQPLVENAIRHGVATQSGATALEIRARRERNELVLEVCDRGPGPPVSGSDVPTGEGVGLANLRDRITTLYGTRASVTLAPRTEGGACATVRLPWRTLAAT